MVESDFSRSSNMMDMFEHQGTAAAELASEDYANHHRVRPLASLGVYTPPICSNDPYTISTAL